MSSHKTYIKQLKPLSFITFDTNTLWDNDSKLLLHGETINDESDTSTSVKPINALLHSDDVNRPSYMMGQNSMVENLITDNYSVIFSQNSYDTLNDFPFAKSYLEIPYENRLLLGKSFSISMIYNKNMNDRNLMYQFTWDSVNNKYIVYNPSRGQYSYNYNTLTRTIIRKGSGIGLYYVMPYSGSDYLQVVFPNNSGLVYFYNIPGGGYNRDISLNMTHEYIVMDDGRWYTKSTVYIDARVIYYYESSPVYGTYVGGNTSSIEIGGNNLAWDYNYLDDRQTSPIRFDQIAIFDYALSADQVGNIYKKIYSYKSIITRAYPDMYYQFNEDVNATYFSDIIKNNSQYNINIYGSSSQVQRGIVGVHGAYGTTAVKVTDSGMLYCKPYSSSYYTYWNPSGDCTIEFFASFGTSSKGIILSLQDNTQPYRGICLMANCLNNVEASGALQLTVTDGKYINPPRYNARGEVITYNDNVVRHYAIRKVGSIVELWINAVLIGSVYQGSGNLTNSLNQLFLFGAMPGNLAVNGTIQHLAFYSRALTQTELSMRSSYILTRSINGQVTVNGIGQVINIRAYTFNDGELLAETTSDGNGNYVLSIPTDDYINVIFMDVGNVNIRPKVIGPTKADTYTDYPWM